MFNSVTHISFSSFSIFLYHLSIKRNPTGSLKFNITIIIDVFYGNGSPIMFRKRL